MAIVTVGDKIGISAPTVGGSTDLWGGDQNSNTFPELDEHVYAPREDRNLVITGGGKISWDSGTGQVSFTGNIVIYNHITANTVSITTAGSPVTLDTALKVGYVKINRKPSSNQSITSVTVAAAGALPNTNSDADAGVLVLFMRTSDSTLWIPWARREIMSGDHWTFGTALSWYERIATSHKAGFKYGADSSQVSIPGSATAPAIAMIDGKIYANTSNATMDLDTAGRNGLDTGAKAANTLYYLYAITPTSGRTFDVVCSVTAPTTGPTGFSNWSYLGAFHTVGASAIAVFNSSQGRFVSEDIQGNTHTGNTSWNAETYIQPATIKAVFGMLFYSGAGGAGDQGFVSGLSGGNAAHYTVLQVNSVEIQRTIEIPVSTPGTLYLRTSDSTNTVGFYQTGWYENPMEYR